MRLSKRARRLPIPSLIELPELENRCLPATLVYVGQDGNDYAGPDAGTGPDGLQDVHLKLVGLTNDISYVTITGSTGLGMKWESGVNPNGAAAAHYFKDATDSSVGHIYINPKVRSNSQGSPLPSPLSGTNSSTGDLVTLQNNHSLQVTIRYANGTTETTNVATVASLASPPLATPAVTQPTLNTTTLAVAWDPNLTAAGEVHLTVTNVPSALNTGAIWVLTDQAGRSWVNQSGYQGHNYLTVTQSGSTVHIYFRPIRDESTSVIAGTSTTMTLTGQTASANELYTARFVGQGWDPRAGTNALGAAYPTIVDSEALLRTALNGGYGTIQLKANTQITITQPLQVKDSVRIVGNGATLYFDQGNTADWPAQATGAIYVANAGPNHIRLELENFTIRFANATLRWANPPATPSSSYPALWDPENDPLGLPRAVISTRDGTGNSGIGVWVHGNDNRNNQFVSLRDMNISGPPAFSPTFPGSNPPGIDPNFHVYVGEPAVETLTTNGSDRGEIIGSTFRGGSIRLRGGPWTVTDNTITGTMPNTYSSGAFSVEFAHDLVLSRNTVYQGAGNGPIMRFLNIAVSGFNSTITDNSFQGGQVGNEARFFGSHFQNPSAPNGNYYQGFNAPEVILTETNSVAFEGRPAAVSADGRLLTIRDSINGIYDAWGIGRTGERLIVSILSSSDPSQVGQWRLVSHLVSTSIVTPGSGSISGVPVRTATFLLQDPLPIPPSGDFVITIGEGFSGVKIHNNQLDLTGKSATGVVLHGANYGTEVIGNTITGGTVYTWPYTGVGISVTAYWANRTGTQPDYWTHNPSFGVKIRNNTIRNSLGGVLLAMTSLQNANRSSANRTYLTADVASNTFAWTRDFYDNSANAHLRDAFPTLTIGEGFSGGTYQSGQYVGPHPWTVGGPNGFVDPGAIKVTVDANRAIVKEANGAESPRNQPTGQVYAGYVNGTKYAPPTPASPAPYNLQNLDIYGAGNVGIIDDDNTGGNGFAKTGTWDYFDGLGATNSYGGDSSTANAIGTSATPTATATWTFTNLTPGVYRIYGSWQPSSNRASDAPFTVKDGSAPLGTVRMNQRSDSPVYADYYDANSRPWWRLGGTTGTFTLTGTQLSVTLANNAASGVVVADAIRIERVESASILDDDQGGTTPGFTKTGTWDYFDGLGITNSYGGDSSTANAIGTSATPTATATWTFTNLTPGVYRIYGSWQPSSNRASDAPFTVKDGSAPLGTVRMNQRSDSPVYADYYDANSRPWWRLGGTTGTFTLTGTQLSVTLANNATSGVVVADAIRIERMIGQSFSSLMAGDLPRAAAASGPSADEVANGLQPSSGEPTTLGASATAPPPIVLATQGKPRQSFSRNDVAFRRVMPLQPRTSARPAQLLRAFQGLLKGQQQGVGA